ncbi:hypothetical protein LTR85_004903 [Meristemomyces frigidus]|nr:hypothetical protein LTR85_004903 [Meristemomyces frigidus]
MARNIAQRLLSAVKVKQLPFIICFILVVLFAIMDKHCLAKDLKGRRCGKDITPKDLIEALGKFKIFSSDFDLLDGDLEDTAGLCTCKNKYYAKPHCLQAPAIAKGWIKQAEELQKILVLHSV